MTVEVLAATVIDRGGARVVGPVRKFEPVPGLDADLTVLLAGGLCFVALVSVAGLAAVVVGDRAVERRGVAGDPAFVRRLPLTTAMAVRFTRPASATSGRGGARPAIAGVSTATLLLIGVLTFAAGLHRLVDTPGLYGWTFDASIFLGYQSTPEQKVAAAAAIEPQLADDTHVAGVTELFGADVDVDGRALSAVGTSGAGGAFTVTRGHPPSAPDEVVLGARAGSAIGASSSIGSTIHITAAPDGGQGGDYTVVGEAVFPDFGGDGVWMTVDGLRRVAPDTPPSQLGIRFAAHTTAAEQTTVLALATQAVQDNLPDPSLDTPVPPSDTDGLVGIDALPLALGVALALAVMVTLVHTLLLALRARRRDVATLRVCGYTSREVWLTVLTTRP